jgi:hypothetical protein
MFHEMLLFFVVNKINFILFYVTENADNICDSSNSKDCCFLIMARIEILYISNHHTVYVIPGLYLSHIRLR